MKTKRVNDQIGLGSYQASVTVKDPKTNKDITISSEVPEWHAEIVALRRQRVPFSEIAKELKRPLETVYRVYYSLMNDNYTAVAESLNAIRQEELELLDSQVRHLLDLQNSDKANLKIIDSLIKVMERRSKLLGLDAPERVEASVVTSSLEDQLKMLDAEYVAQIVDSIDDDRFRKAK